jgi:hypothetical protein
MYSKLAPVVRLRRKLRGHRPERDDADRDQHREHADHGPWMRNAHAQRALVKRREPLEEAIHRRRKTVAMLLLGQPRCEHRRQRERDQRRERDRGREREPELAEQAAQIPRQERDRHEHRNQRERRRDHREPDLARARDRRDERRLTELRAAVHVLEHDDRVVDDEADREHEAEQRQHVDRVAERVHHGQRRHDRHRNRHGRDQRGTQVAEKHVDDGKHGGERKRNGDQHLLERGLDRQRVVDAHLERRSLREARLHPLDLRPHAARDVERIALRLRLHLHHEPGTAVEAAVGTLVLGRETHVGKLPKAHEMPIGAACDDEIAKVLLGLEAHHRTQRKFARARLEPTRGQLDVLAAQRVLDVRDGELARGERLAVDPDAHRVASSTDDVYVGDAGHRGHPIDDVPLGKVREVEHRHRIGRER